MEPSRRRVELALARRGVPAEGKEVLHPHRQELLDQPAELLAGVPHAGEMGHRLEAGAPDLPDQVHGPVPGAPAGAVGDRDEARLEGA